MEQDTKVSAKLQEILNGVDAELHKVETEVHQRRTELELERKKWEFNVRDAQKEISHMEEQMRHYHKEIDISRQMNEEEITKLHHQLENFTMKADGAESLIHVREADIKKLKEQIEKDKT